MTHNTDKRQKCLMYRLMLFHYEYFIPEKTEMEAAEICRTKKAYAPIFGGSPLCLKHFKYSSMAELPLFICVFREQPCILHVKNNRASDPSCIGNYAFRLLDSTDSRQCRVICSCGNKRASLILHRRSILQSFLKLALMHKVVVSTLPRAPC